MTPLLERLRAETRPLHEQTEQLFYTEALQNGTLSVDEYIHLLRTHFVFHQALEEAISRHSDFFRNYALETRRKTPWLLADLKNLNVVPAPRMPELFAGWSPVELLGAAYVGEGSMLGGTVIWKLLQKNEAIFPPLANAQFYKGYGPSTGSYWRNFGAFLTKQGAQQPDNVVDAAKQAFVDYQAVFQQNTVKSPAKTL